MYIYDNIALSSNWAENIIMNNYAESQTFYVDFFFSKIVRFVIFWNKRSSVTGAKKLVTDLYTVQRYRRTICVRQKCEHKVLAAIGSTKSRQPVLSVCNGIVARQQTLSERTVLCVYSLFPFSVCRHNTVVSAWRRRELVGILFLAKARTESDQN